MMKSLRLTGNIESRRGVIRKITLLDISYVKIQDYQREGKIVKQKPKNFQ